MANTYELLASTTVGVAGTSAIDFTLIPATYTDLIVKMSTRSNKADVDQLYKVEFNGSSASYTSRRIDSDGSSAPTSGSSTIIYAIGTGNNATASTFGNCEIYVTDYATSNYKCVSVDGVSETNATNVGLTVAAGLWSNSAAINRITLTPNGGQTILQYSTAYLYGVKNA